MVLVSRRAGWWVPGSVVSTQSRRFASGLSPVPDGLNDWVSGNATGSICSGMACGSPSAHTIGIGSPQ